MSDCLESLKVLSARKRGELFNTQAIGTSPDVSGGESDSSEERGNREKEAFEEIVKIRRERERETGRKTTLSIDRDVTL